MIHILSFITGLIENLKYFGIFIGTFIEGPAVGMLTGSLIKLGYLNLYLSYLVYVIGDFTADCLYYSMGYLGRIGILKKFNSSTTIKKAEKYKILFHKHPNKIIVFGKLTHFFGLPILIEAGLTHYPWKKFLIFDLIATLIKSAILLFIGFYLTSLWVSINNTINYIGLTVTFLTVIFLSYFLIKFYKERKKL